ncbi:MAG: VOC family protein [Myxococcota bacterium]|nr:VOC family protein [Myxococcota bacterium]
MFDHVGIHVSDLDASKLFYEAALVPLGFTLLQENEVGESRWLVFGTEAGAPFFVVSSAPSRQVAPSHLAFAAPSEDAVRHFHAAGLSAGGRDNGLPGPRAGAGRYFAAYLLDPDGFNIEAGVRGEGPAG